MALPKFRRKKTREIDLRLRLNVEKLIENDLRLRRVQRYTMDMS
jgi:hypothetical protein